MRLKQITIDGNNVTAVCPCCYCLVVVTGFTEEEIEQYKNKPKTTPTKVLFPWLDMANNITLVSGICQDCQSTGARIIGARLIEER